MNRSKLVSLTMVFFFTTIASSAQITIWTGNDQNNPHKWNDSDNWNTGEVPSGGDTVLIDNGDSVSITTVTPELSYIELDNGSVLMNGGLLTLTSNTYAIRVWDGSALYNEGEIYVDDAGSSGTDPTIHMLRSSLYNHGLIFIDGVSGYGIRVEVSSKLYNFGIIHIESPNIALNSGAGSHIENHDSMYLSSEIFNGFRSSDSSSILINTAIGRINVITASRTADAFYLKGHVLNSGKISTNNAGSGIAVNPDGRFDHLAGSILVQEISGFQTQAASIEVEMDGAFLIAQNAEMRVMAVIDNNPLEVHLGGTFQCQGVLELIRID